MALIKCKECGRELLDDEVNLASENPYLYKGFCKDCYKKVNPKKNNIVAQILQVISIIIFIVCIISFLISFEKNFWTGLITLGIGIIMGAVILGIGEIIQKLQNIEDNIL